MITLELIELADLVRPAEIANEIIRQNPSIDIPIPLAEIAHETGIREIQYNPFDGLEGALIANPEKSRGIILINEGARHHRQRFTLGHELGHFLIPHHGSRMSCASDDLRTSAHKMMTSAQKIELEANQFSAELLMPVKLFRGFTGYRDEPSLECLIDQSEHFDVSFEACANRYISLHDDPVAIVFSHQGKVRYSLRNDEFPFWIMPRKGDKVPSGSQTHKAGLCGSNTKYSGMTESSYWLDENRHFELPEELVEEVYVMENGYVATLLSFEDVLVEVE